MRLASRYRCRVFAFSLGAQRKPNPSIIRFQQSKDNQRVHGTKMPPCSKAQASCEGLHSASPRARLPKPAGGGLPPSLSCSAGAERRGACPASPGHEPTWTRCYDQAPVTISSSFETRCARAEVRRRWLEYCEETQVALRLGETRGHSAGVKRLTSTTRMKRATNGTRSGSRGDDTHESTRVPTDW